MEPRCCSRRGFDFCGVHSATSLHLSLHVNYPPDPSASYSFTCLSKAADCLSPAKMERDDTARPEDTSHRPAKSDQILCSLSCRSRS